MLKMMGQLRDELLVELKQAYMGTVTNINADDTIQVKCEDITFDDLPIYNGDISYESINKQQVLVLQIGKRDYIALLITRGRVVRT
ncbi:MAG: hypothetical protein ACRDDX_10570 [Cellulosilyticaceae bacterium]